jgi:hypothetical protein
MVMETGTLVGSSTLRVTPVAVMVPTAAVMVVVPPARPVARPVVAEIDALSGLLDVHVTPVVRVCVVLSEYVPTTVNCCVAIYARLPGVAGEMARLVSTALVTVTAKALLDLPFIVAVTVAAPFTAPVPAGEPVVKVTVPAGLLVPEAWVEMSPVVPSL